MTYEEAKELADFVCQYGWFTSAEGLMKRYADLPYEEAQKRFTRHLGDIVEKSYWRHKNTFYIFPEDYRP